MRKRCELESYNFLYNFSILNTNLFLLNLKLHDWFINYDAFKCWIAIGWQEKKVPRTNNADYNNLCRLCGVLTCCNQEKSVNVSNLVRTNEQSQYLGQGNKNQW